MYLISRGKVAVYGANDEFLCELGQGELTASSSIKSFIYLSTN
jgi:hypothetical protein